MAILLNLRNLFSPKVAPEPKRSAEEIAAWIDQWKAQEEAAGRVPLRTACYAAIASAAFLSREKAAPWVREKISSHRADGRPKKRS